MQTAEVSGKPAVRPYEKIVVDLEERRLVERARRGDAKATQAIMKRYTGFVRMKASSYFLVGGDADDLVQEGLVGLHKAIRDYRQDRETTFRSFAELCVTRQIITAIKTATRHKHAPLNDSISFSHTPAGQSAEDSLDTTVEDSLAGSPVDDPLMHVISSQELRSLVEYLADRLSKLEVGVLHGYLEGRSYEEIAEILHCDTKTVDNALQRVKRKVNDHMIIRQAL